MSRILRAITWLLSAFTCVAAIAVLIHYGDHPIEWISVSIIVLFILGLVLFILNQEKHTRMLSTKNAFVHNVIQGISEFVEIVVFDEFGKTTFTTHPFAYPHRKEFLRKLSKRLQPSKDFDQIQSWIEDHHHGEVVLPGHVKANGIIPWWRIRVLPLPIFTHSVSSVLVLISNITTFYERLQHLEEYSNRLEGFLNHAPFGLFYLDSKLHVVGANNTFCQWVTIDKAEIIGKRIEEFVDNLSVDKKSISSSVLLKTHGAENSKKAICFYGQINQNIRPVFVMKTDEEKIPSNANEYDFSVVNLSQGTFSNARIPAVMLDTSGNLVAYNAAFGLLLTAHKINVEDVLKVGMLFSDLSVHKLRSQIQEIIATAAINISSVQPFEMIFDGGLYSTAYLSQIANVHDNRMMLMLQFIDISEQKRREQQFIQSQKMQAVGQLAGGIAHDFNNLLTAMIGFCDLLLQRYMPNDPSYTDVVQIKQNANRATNLVRQLLAFSRQQALQPKIIHITDILAEISVLLRRLIGAAIELKVTHGRELWPVKVDAGQFEQVIINLVVNARDAMNGEGKLFLRTSNTHLEEPLQMGTDIVPTGDYVLIEVEDTGHGIKSEDIDHIFEPFYSTKEIGSGTGLGLSTVYGIVKQTGGFIYVDSEINKGTIFKIYLPRYMGKIEENIPDPDILPVDLSGSERILLVEDEDAVRIFSARALREKGYEVIEFESGEKALEWVEKAEKYDLLLTDVVMPKMDGPTLVNKIYERFGPIKTIFISGYTEDTFRKNLQNDEHIHFLPKPYTLKDLAAKVKDVLNTRNNRGR